MTEENTNQEHLIMAGHLLTLMIWFQNVMTDLIILKANAEVLTKFKNFNTETDLGIKRIEYWQKSFPSVKTEFINLFQNISQEHISDLNTLQHLKDFFAHARYGLKDTTIYYQPTKSRKDLAEKISSLTKSPFDKTKTFLKVVMNREKYAQIFKAIMVFENTIFPKVALELGIDINRLK